MNPNKVVNSQYGQIIINTNDKGVGASISEGSYFEPENINIMIGVINTLLQRKDKITFYDVGANIGTHTLAIASTFKNKVFIRSFEAQRQVYYMLCGTIALNGLRNVYAHHCAVGGYYGLIDIDLPDYNVRQNFGGLEIKEIDKSDNQDMIFNSSENIEMMRLDQFHEPIDFIKMDIEGMEEEALFRSSLMLEEYMPVCYVEIFKSNQDRIFSFFKSLGYKCYSNGQDMLAMPTGMDVTILNFNPV
jgi:FkbM family methyltransferase